MPTILEKLIKNQNKFWSKVNRIENSCWVWNGGISKTCGYGYFYADNCNIGAHRAAYIINTKQEIPKGYCVCHKCDNKICVNPHHLFLGTIKDNNLDMIKKGRACFPKPRIGSLNRSCKLDEIKVKEIINRISQGKTNKEIASEFCVSQQIIYNIKIGRTWRHLDGK